MAHHPLIADDPLDTNGTGDRSVLRRCRGRPRLTDSDRAQRRLESRKKYDVRRVYLGEAHKLWSELRRRTGLSDAGLAEYLILLNSTYGDKYRRKHCREKPGEVVPGKRGKDRKQRVSSLQSLVCWYQEHSGSCPHEPQLRALEPQPDFSTVARWQCDSNHSFVQYLFSPLRGESESELEERLDEDSDEEARVRSDVSLTKDTVRQRMIEDKDVEDISECPAVQTTEAISQHVKSSPEASRDAALTGQPTWEVEVQQQSSPTTTLHSVPSKDLKQAEGEMERLGVEEITAVGCGYDCVTMAASLADEVERTEDSVLSQSLSGSVPPAVQEQTDLLDPQTLQTVVSGCEIPDQRTALEGSQLIIITGPSYEALASEGIQVNMGSGNMEEVTCTVIEGVSYNQVCTPDSKVQTAEGDDSMTGLSDSQFAQPTMELSSDAGLQTSLISVRSRRSRRGPVIEPDGMLKMFHCPYEGCSQVYVAISSFQNHVNLVHRKGRTKVCPHPGCGKKFYLSNHLHRHMIIHSEVRDFICETCGKSFKRKNHLEVHRRTHTGETPLQCEICGYQCRQRASLNWHMKKHTTEAHYNYTCEFCSKRFEKLDSVKFHKLKSHPEQLAT
uniref:Zinc finger protein 653 n=3 Tax=Nothobranchiidae TaxID=405002 RepID=A0A1A7WAG7_9TELE